jgi:beta-glucanase (GH16 family)
MKITKDYQVVYAADAHFLARCGAKRLADFLGLPCVADTAPEKETEIVLGKTNRADFEIEENTCRRCVDKKKVFLQAIHYQPLCEVIDRWISKKATEIDDAEKLYVSKVPLHWENYNLVWNDEFNGTQLDTERWIGRAYMDTKDVLMSMDAGVVDVEDGKLVLTTHVLDRRDPQARYLTNYAITTSATMNYQFGYMEIRAKVPHYALGEWPSWWLLTGECDLAKEAYIAEHGHEREVKYGVEVDVYEVFSHRGSVVPNIHKWHKGGPHEQLSGIDRGSSKNGTGSYIIDHDADANDWHVFGYLWTPDEMSFSVDGDFFYSYDLHRDFGKAQSGVQDLSQPLFVLFNNMLFTEGNINGGGAWAQGCAVRDNELFPLRYQIDYCRLYQLDGRDTLYLPKEPGHSQWVAPNHVECKFDHGKYRSPAPVDYENGPKTDRDLYDIIRKPQN